MRASAVFAYASILFVTALPARADDAASAQGEGAQATQTDHTANPSRGEGTNRSGGSAGAGANVAGPGSPGSARGNTADSNDSSAPSAVRQNEQPGGPSDQTLRQLHEK